MTIEARNYDLMPFFRSGMDIDTLRCESGQQANYTPDIGVFHEVTMEDYGEETDSEKGGKVGVVYSVNARDLFFYAGGVSNIVTTDIDSEKIQTTFEIEKAGSATAGINTSRNRFFALDFKHSK